MGETEEKYECQECFDMVPDSDMSPSCADLCWACWELLQPAEVALYERKELSSVNGKTA